MKRQQKNGRRIMAALLAGILFLLCLCFPVAAEDAAGTQRDFRIACCTQPDAAAYEKIDLFFESAEAASFTKEAGSVFCMEGNDAPFLLPDETEEPSGVFTITVYNIAEDMRDGHDVLLHLMEEDETAARLEKEGLLTCGTDKPAALYDDAVLQKAGIRKAESENGTIWFEEVEYAVSSCQLPDTEEMRFDLLFEAKSLSLFISVQYASLSGEEAFSGEPDDVEYFETEGQEVLLEEESEASSDAAEAAEEAQDVSTWSEIDSASAPQDWGSKYINDYFGFTRAEFVKNLEANMDRLIDTPYGWVGAPEPGKQMQCTGFVAWAIHEVARSHRNGVPFSDVPYGHPSWGYGDGSAGEISFYSRQNIRRRGYWRVSSSGGASYALRKQAIQKTIDSMLENGNLKKGDILWSFVGGGHSSEESGHHTGIYWGDYPGDNKFLHAASEGYLGAAVIRGHSNALRISEIDTMGAAVEFLIVPMSGEAYGSFNVRKDVQNGKVRVRNRVEGTGAEKNKTFRYTCSKLSQAGSYKKYNADGKQVTAGAGSKGGTKIRQGSSFTLLAGQYAELLLPAGTSYSITQREEDNYTTKNRVIKGRITPDAMTRFEVHLKNSSGNVAADTDVLWSVSARKLKGTRRTDAKGAFSVLLKKGKTVSFTLPAGMRYSVQEKAADGSELKDFKVSAVARTGKVDPDKRGKAVFTNIPKTRAVKVVNTRKKATLTVKAASENGTLRIKNIVRGQGADSEKAFHYSVETLSAAGKYKEYDSSGVQVTSGAGSKEGTAIQQGGGFSLTAGQSAVLILPAGTEYSIVQDEYAQYETNGGRISGRIRTGGRFLYKVHVTSEKNIGTKVPWKIRGTDGTERSGGKKVDENGNFAILLSGGERVVFDFTRLTVSSKYKVTVVQKEGYSIEKSGAYESTPVTDRHTVVFRNRPNRVYATVVNTYSSN